MNDPRESSPSAFPVSATARVSREVWTPASVDELADAVRSSARVIAVGGGTKPRLAQVGGDVARISTAKLRGIVEYEPGEFTFTARAGTPVREIAAALADRGQHLPFDPVLVDAGATLGGTVAAGVCGPGRFRSGGLRDFILAVQFVDGAGRRLRMGGKVVKNAAGFDLPKFFVGSIGRFGVLTELTFKVFPRPAITRTLRLVARDAAAKMRLMTEAAGERWEIDALEAAADDDFVLVRLAGPAAALDLLQAGILARWTGSILASPEADNLWLAAREFRWTHEGGTLVKAALTPTQVPAFAECVRMTAGARGWIGAGGNVGYLSLPAGTPCPPLAWPAIALRGDAPLWPGPSARFEVMRAVKRALDPENRFPALDE
jgi:glycolate oxidase FAD binding subunit